MRRRYTDQGAGIYVMNDDLTMSFGGSSLPSVAYSKNNSYICSEHYNRINGSLTSVTMNTGDTIWTMRKQNSRLLPTNVGSGKLETSLSCDLRDNVTVIDQNGALKEINNYYPYGGLMGGAVTGIQPDKYGGKELDRENGIDWYDFEARYQDPMLPMFTTQDPLAEQTPGISPYAYCAGNPVRYIDPKGMNPIYDPYGSFLGQTNEGFTGLVYVFWGTSTLDNISDMSIDDAIDTYGLMPMDDFSLTQDSTDDDPLLLSNQAKSNIITHIISHFENEKIFEKVFTMKSIENERIDIRDIGSGKNWTTTYHTVSKAPIVIEGSGTFQTDYEGTVENISATILYHEWYGHGMHHLSDENKNHHKAYWCVMQSPLWEVNTEKYKEYIKGKYNSYLRKERRGK